MGHFYLQNCEKCGIYYSEKMLRSDDMKVSILISLDKEWLEEHPDVKLEGALAPLKGLADDANPVVVIVEP